MIRSLASFTLSAMSLNADAASVPIADSALKKALSRSIVSAAALKSMIVSTLATASSAALNTKMSPPAPPVSTSLPPPPVMTLAPLLPVSASPKPEPDRFSIEFQVSPAASPLLMAGLARLTTTPEVAPT